MDSNELQKEQAHLHDTKAVAQQLLQRLAGENRMQLEELKELGEDWLENRQIDTGGLYSAQGFADLLERDQEIQMLKLALSAKDENERSMRRLARIIDHPYFARIDFQFEDGLTKPIYIGRATLMEDDTMKIHVYDWRVPIASVFYRYGVGPAEYEAPAGTIQGQVMLKRQYEIRHGELIYFFDADEQVLDTFLRDILSGPTSTAMKSIVETIQRDQDRIIRDLKADLLMVQGTAGSGKTSVALHRVAYLMYQGLQENRLAPGDILIIAPNATFERYISQVLPDLGESQVQTMLSEDLLEAVLPEASVEPRSAWVEAYLLETDEAEKEAMRRARDIKGSRAFLALLDRLMHELPRRWIPFSQVDYDGGCVMDAQEMRTAICNSTKMVPLAAQLRFLENEIWHRIHALRPARYEKLLRFAGEFPQHAMEATAFARMLSIRESGRILRQVRSFTRIDCAALYRALFASKTAFARLSAGLIPPEEAEALRVATLAGLDAKEIPYEDAAAIAYLHARTHGCRAYSALRQVVVDEAQDLDTLHAELLRLLFPNARFTVLGDIHQSLAGTVNPSIYEEIETTLHKKNNLMVTLDKSFRCTREIWAFSAQFLPEGAAGECFSRSGDVPQVYTAADEAALDALMLREAQACRGKGCASIAVLCKTQRDAARLYQRLRHEPGTYLIEGGVGLKSGGLAIVPLYMAKGLEFDAAFLYDVDAAHYRDAADKNLLYIGCTRALHQLKLFYTGDKSPLLPDGVEVTI